MADLDNLRRRGPRTDGGHGEHPGPRTGPRCPRARRSRPAWRLEGAARPDDAEKTRAAAVAGQGGAVRPDDAEKAPAETARGGKWRSGRIVRVGAPDALGGSRMIPRLCSQRCGVRGGTILPGRQNQDPMGPPTTPTHPQEPAPTTTRPRTPSNAPDEPPTARTAPGRNRLRIRSAHPCAGASLRRGVPGPGGGQSAVSRWPGRRRGRWRRPGPRVAGRRGRRRRRRPGGSPEPPARGWRGRDWRRPQAP